MSITEIVQAAGGFVGAAAAAWAAKRATASGARSEDIYALLVRVDARLAAVEDAQRVHAERIGALEEFAQAHDSPRVDMR